MSDSPSAPPEPSSGGVPLRRLVVVALSLLAVAAYGRQFVGVFRPPPGQLLDFVQEWLSARNYWTGHPVYEPQQISVERHTGTRYDMASLPWNAHPPAAVLAALPTGLAADYRTAHFVWNLATLPGWVLAVVVVFRELRVPWRPDTVLAMVAVTVSSYPVLIQVGQGQLNFVMLPLLVLGWAADRRGLQGWAGVCFGLAAGVKLFPAFVFGYLLFSGRWRALAVAVLAAAALNGIALALFGADTFRDYVRDVLPSLKVFRASWRNASVTGFWSRLFGPDSLATTASVALTSLAVVGVVAWLAWRARWRDVATSDRAFAATLVAMLLVSPLLWTHAFVLLLLPLALLWTRLDAGWQRSLLYLALPVLWVPENFFVRLILGGETAADWLNRHDIGAPPGVDLTVLSLFTYALAVVFALAAFGRWRDAASPKSPAPREPAPVEGVSPPP